MVAFSEEEPYSLPGTYKLAQVAENIGFAHVAKDTTKWEGEGNIGENLVGYNMSRVINVKAVAHNNALIDSRLKECPLQMKIC